jgi:uncharacterized protein (TIGR02246 family)
MDVQHQQVGTAEGAIAESRAAFVAALNGGDAKAACSVYADEARLLPPSAELLRGRDAIEAFWKAGLAAGITEVELEAVEVERDGRLAYEIGRYALRLTPGDGGTVIDRGKYVLVHERQQDGAWRWAVEMFNPETPPVRAGGQPNERGRTDVQGQKER